MKRTFKKVLSTVVASLFVLQSASLATVGIGAVDADVLNYVPTIDGILDDAYLSSAKVALDTSKVAGMGTSPTLKGTAYYLWDNGYLYMAAEITGDPNLAATGKDTWTDNAAFTFFKKGEEQVEAGRLVIEPMEGKFSFTNTNGTACGKNLPAVGTWAQINDYSSEIAFTADTVNGSYIVEARMKFDSAAVGTQYSINFGALDGQNYAVIGDWGWAGPVGGTLTLSSDTFTPSHTHVYDDDYTTDVYPTCTTLGSKSRHCVDYATCKGYTDYVVIDMLAHDLDDNGVCKTCGKAIAFKDAPVIDGIIDEAYFSSYSLKLNKSISGGMGECKTLDATAYYLWNDGYLYFAATVSGDPTMSSSSDWKDSVAFSFFTNFNGNYQREDGRLEIRPFDNEVLFSNRNGIDGVCGANFKLGESIAITNTEDVAYTVDNANGTYTVEARMQFKTAKAGTQYDINFGVMDGHTTQNFGHYQWAGPSDGSFVLGNNVFVPAHVHEYSDEYTVDVAATCTHAGSESRHCLGYDVCGMSTDAREIPKLAHTAGELTTTEPTCVEEGKTTSACTVCNNTFTVSTTPALGHTTTSGRCERCGEYVNAPSNVPYATAVVDGVKDVAYDSGAKYYVNGATAYVVYDKDYFYAYVEAADAENIAYLTIGSPDNTPNVGGFWTNTASVKFDFTAKNLWTTDSFACSIFNQNGASTFADNISVDTGATCIAKAGVDYAYADDANAVEIKIHIGEGISANNYAGRAFVGSTMYYLGLGTKTDGISLDKGPLHVQLINGDCTNVVLDKCLGGCVNTERVTTVEPTCTAVGTSVEKCTVCGAEVEGSAQDVAMLDHDYKRTVTVEATCEVAGTSAEKCTACGAIKDGTAVEIPALGHDWEYTVDTAPTCTADGIAIARACKRTGCDVYEEGSFVLPALGHNYNELGICANCGDNKSLKVATYSVTLMDVLNINAKINKADVAAYDSFYVKFVEHYKDGSADNVKIVTEYSYESSRDRYVFAYGSTPQCAVDDVDVYVYGVKDGVTYESTAVYTANITSYLYTMLGRSTDTSLNRLMVHLLDYIAAAQQFAEYSTASLANANLTDAMKALRLPENTNYNNTFSETVNEGVSGATYLARSLYCDDSISFKYNFTFDASKYSIGDIKVVVKYKDDGDTMAEYTGDQIVYDTARSRYYVVVGLIAQNLSKDFEINVYTLDGTLISNKTLVNSIESMAAAYSAYPQYTDFLAAMMQYGRAAAAYANR